MANRRTTDRYNGRHSDTIEGRAAGESAITAEDVRHLIIRGAEAGVIQPAEREIVEGAFELGDREVRELMMPCVRVVWLDPEARQ